MSQDDGRTDPAWVDAVLAVPEVVAVVADPDAPRADAGSRAAGADTGEATHVHVTVTDAGDPSTTAQNVQDAAHRVTGGRVDVTIEEILER
ncbi:hypothetical protein [Williamsia sp. M5A3_1d]